jgi:hypothetical protein
VQAGALSLINAASLTRSVIRTAISGAWAYFSPLTRAWELALGALVTVLAPTIARLRHAKCATGSGYRRVARNRPFRNAFYLGHSLLRPAVTLPLVSSAVLVAVGCANVRTIVERALSARPSQWAARGPRVNVTTALATSHHLRIYRTFHRHLCRCGTPGVTLINQSEDKSSPEQFRPDTEGVRSP